MSKQKSVSPVSDFPHTHHDNAFTSMQPRLTQEQERALVARACEGEDVRDEIILSMQPRIRSMAIKYAQRALTGTDWLDLAQEANVAMLETYPQALEKQNTYAYLMGVARLAMLAYLSGRKDLIKTHPSVGCVPVLSLNKPLRRGSEPDDLCLGDLIATETNLSSPSCSEERYTALYASIEALTDVQKKITRCHYGLNEAPETLSAISRHFAWSLSNTAKHKKLALQELRTSLAPLFPQYCAGGTR